MLTSKLIRAANAALAMNKELDREKSGSFVVLSFHTHQARRILEIQEKLVVLLEEKDGLIPQQDRVDDPAMPHQSLGNLELPGGRRLTRTRTLDTVDTDIDKWLHRYARAVRDYKTLVQEVEPGQLPAMERDWPSQAYNLIFHYRRYKELHGQRQRRDEQLGDLFHWEQGDALVELNQEIRLRKERQRAWLERLWMGVFGGVALIGPMLLMSLRRTLLTSVITASGATMLFAVVLAILGRDLSGKDVLAATAGYAAVLVVFVGTSLEVLADDR